MTIRNACGAIAALLAAAAIAAVPLGYHPTAALVPAVAAVTFAVLAGGSIR